MHGSLSPSADPPNRRTAEFVANELVNWFNQVDATYRADLRELNELNFARFDARLEQRTAEIKADVRNETATLEQRVSDLRAELRQEMARLEQKVNERSSALESRMDTGFATLRADMVKWLFGMLITLLGTMIALAKLGG